jgi:hypothetical protein
VPQLIPGGELVTIPSEASGPALVTERVKVAAEALKVAVTAAAAVIVTVQAPVPAQAPDQPAKVEPVAGVAVRVTVVPLVKLVEHVAPQLIPRGELVMVPLPVPVLVIERAKVVADVLKVAVTAVAAFILTVHVPVPAQAPDQPAKVEPAAGVAVSVTAVPPEYFAEQVAPQLMPAGELVTVPLPVPALVTVRALVPVEKPKVAVTVVAAVMVTVHVPVPEQAPDQPVKAAKAEAVVAVRVTVVPLEKFAEQVAPQLIPLGELVTVPNGASSPAFVTEREKLVADVLKVAVTEVAAFIVTVHAPTPEQAPLQPAKVEPAAGGAVRVTTVPVA